MVIGIWSLVVGYVAKIEASSDFAKYQSPNSKYNNERGNSYDKRI